MTLASAVPPDGAVSEPYACRPVCDITHGAADLSAPASPAKLTCPKHRAETQGMDSNGLMALAARLLLGAMATMRGHLESAGRIAWQAL